jgi:ATP/maltotriose-dependent transcriptional regulator MalT
MLLLASIYQRNGRIKEADVLLDNLLNLAESTNYSGVLETARAYSALFSYQRGNLMAAYRWLDREVQEMPVILPSFSLPAQVIMARLLIERGSDRDLMLASNVALRMERLYSGTVLPPKRALQIFALRSMIEEKLGNRLMSDEFMSEAMAFVKPNGFVRTLIELGSSLLPILLRLQPSDLRNALIATFQSEVRQPVRLTVAIEQYDTPISETVLPPSRGDRSRELLSETLTSRELEVLKLLRQRLSNQEIADALFISPQTVKRHNSNIFNKLGVRSRRQAIRRSEEIGLLPLADSDNRGAFP